MNDRVRSRRAGICIPLFSLRSTKSWGIGEIGDLPLAVAWLREAGQATLQVLPLNELQAGESSPYSALSAMAIDPKYITIPRIEDAPDFEAMWPDEIEAVRRAPKIAYDRIASLKGRALQFCFDRFYETDWTPGTARAWTLRQYIEQEAWWLDDYSLYRALRAQASERPWTDWDPPLRDRHPAALEDARGLYAREILFYQYVQWIASAQWQAAREQAGDVEILGDFPFMVGADSADVWSRQEEFILDASVGTPPDAFSETGQEWGLPPYNWDAVRKNDFEWIRRRARRMADLYHGFRVDHLVGFYRTYVRPSDGRTPYFFPDAEDAQRALGERVMQAIVDAGADVSVEDLGTVPDFVRESVTRMGLPGYRVFRWEPEDPSAYPALSVAMTGTHDTDPLAPWWESLTADERSAIAAMPSVSRAHPNGAAGLVSPAFTAQIRDAILDAIYHSESDLVLVPIQDVFGWRDRINHPATVGDWNWTYVLPWPADEMAEQPEALACAARLREWSERTGRRRFEAGAAR